MGHHIDKRDNDCKNLLKLFDEVETTTQAIHELIQRGMKIKNDEQALKKILIEIKDKL